MTTNLKSCLKLHKLFLTEVTRSLRLESEGSQVLSSLANISKRVLLLTQYSSRGRHGNVNVMGVLNYCSNTQVLLLQKHFVSLEKSRAFLTDIMRDFQEVLRHLRSLASECVALVDNALIESESAVCVEDEMIGVTFSLQLHEWMEKVLAMFEHEVMRKVRLVTELEYTDVERLNTVHKQWNSNGVMGNIDNDYGLKMPQAKTSQASSNAIPDRSKSKKKKKVNK